MTDDLKIRVLIVDDDPRTRRKIRKLLARHADVEIVGDCDNGHDAVAAIKKYAPDLIFLDVMMPEVDGFGVLERIEEGRRPLVIVVTGYDEFARRAFEVHAVDFLSKPLARRRFDEALNQARTWLAAIKERGAAPRATGSDYREFLGFKAGGRVFFIPTDKVEWIKAEAQYVRLHFGGESPLLRESIGALEAQLDPQKFLRISRSYIVRLDYIKEMRRLPGQKWEVVLRDGKGTRAPLSDSGRKRLAARLKISL